MKINFKLISLVMFVMLICCVSAASAADADNITVPDDADVIEIDEAVDSVDAVESESSECTIEEPTLPTRSNSITVNETNYTTKFNNDGVFNDANVDEVIFVGNFDNSYYNTLKFNQAITITATGSTFTNVGFGLYSNGIVLNGATIIMNAPAYSNCYAIDLQNANHAIVINNKINYTCTADNEANYNFAIKAGNSENLTIYGNEINASVPLKKPNWDIYASIYSDYVAGVAIEYCNNLKFDKNNLTVIGNKRVGSFPTLDAFIIANSANAKIRGNNINESDIVTTTNQYSYIYGIDVYSCNNLLICSNNVNMNGNKSNTNYEGNGTGAAYCIQLTGPHTGVKICNNNLSTRNQGPNLGIYSQNYYGTTNITVCGNNINVTGKAGSDEWSLVSGMELQDTYATVYGNTITVNNTAGYNSTYYAFGISYCQSTSDNHYYDINNNNVTVVNGDYAVFLIDTESVTGNVINNTLIAFKSSGNNSGDNAVNPLDPFNVNVSGNH